MLGFIFSVLSLSFILPGDTVSDEKFAALKFGADGYSVISFSSDMSPLTKKFSVCLWVRQLLSRPSPIAFSYKMGELFVRGSGNYRLFGADIEPSTEITMGEWYQFCGTWSSASRTFRAYINGALAGTYITPSGRTLQTGGTLVLGDYRDPVARGTTGNHFAGEMYNFNMFSKELTGTEVAELSADGLCTQVPEQLEDYRVIKWNEILGLTRRGNVQNIETGCDEAISETEELRLELQRTQAELLEVQGELSETKLELEDTKQQLTDVSETECTMQKENLTKWDVFYSCTFYNKIFTRRSYKQFRTTWTDNTRTLFGKNVTDEVIELFKDLHDHGYDDCGDVQSFIPPRPEGG